MVYNVEVFNIDTNNNICYLGKQLNLENAKLIKEEGEGCFIKGVSIRKHTIHI